MLLLVLFLGPISLEFFTFMFLSSCFLLILSDLAVKVVPFGRVTIFGDTLHLSTIFSIIFFFSVFSCDLYRLFFLILVFLSHLKVARLWMLATQLVFPCPFVFFFSPNIPKTLFYRLFSSTHSKKSSSL